MGGKGGISPMAVGTACGWEGRGTRFDSRLARVVDLLERPEKPSGWNWGIGEVFERKRGELGRGERTADEKNKCHTHSARRIFLEGSGHVVRSF